MLLKGNSAQTAELAAQRILPRRPGTLPLKQKNTPSTESSGDCSAPFTYTGSDTPTAKMLFATDANKATANPMVGVWVTDQSETMPIASGTASLTGSATAKRKYTAYANVYVVITVGSNTAAKQYWHQIKPAAHSGGDGVTVDPATATVAKGAPQQFTASPSAVTWTITTSGKHENTNINNTGLLTVATAETQTSLEITAASTTDATKFGTATVTVTAEGPTVPAGYTVSTVSHDQQTAAGSLGTQAGQIHASYDVVAADDGDLLVSTPRQHVIRRVFPGTYSGLQYAMAGTVGYSGDLTAGSGAAARFNAPSGMAQDSTGKIYLADKSNNKIRTVSKSGNVAGGGAAVSITTDGYGSLVYYQPINIAVDSAGTVYVTIAGKPCVYKITTPGESTGQLELIAGHVSETDTADGSGTTAARFSGEIKDIEIDSNDNLYVTDGNRIRKIMLSNE